MMEPDSYIDPNLTRSDLLVLQTLLSDAQAQSTGSKPVVQGRHSLSMFEIMIR